MSDCSTHAFDVPKTTETENDTPLQIAVDLYRWAADVVPEGMGDRFDEFERRIRRHGVQV